MGGAGAQETLVLYLQLEALLYRSNMNKKNGFKLHVSKQMLMFVADSFASK